MNEDDLPSTRWREVIPDGEAAEIQGFIARIHRYQHGFARGGDGQAHRGFHVKSHAVARGEFTVLPDLPAAARHGVFAAARSFPAWVRFTNGFSAARPDWAPDLAGLSVKLLGVDGAKLLAGEEGAATQDFVALNQPYLPADNAAQLMMISISAANVLTAPLQLIDGLGIAHALKVMAWTLGWTPRRLRLRSVATEDYFSVTPICIGPHAVKFKWQSRQAALPPRRSDSWRNYLRDDLRRRLAAGDLRFDFLAQFYADAARTPIDGAAAWPEPAAPFLRLAELRIPACDLDSEQARHDERMVNGLSFNPWHAIAAHRPIGNIQRARGAIYQASARYWGRDTDPA